jgi:hypothetical protein
MAAIGARKARDLSRDACARLSHLPVALLEWAPALSAADHADHAAVSALSAVESHPGGQGFGRAVLTAEEACERLVSEWQRAERAWRAKGCPDFSTTGGNRGAA